MQLFFRKSGEGQPLIILHGLYGASDNWISIIRSLSDHFTVYAIDQRNHGQSPHMPSHTYEDMVEDLHEFIQQQNIQDPIILGHSMGGKTAMRFAIKYPEIVKKLVVVDIAPKNYSSYQNYGEVTSDHEYILTSLKKIPLDEMKNRTEINKELEKYFKDERLSMFLMKNIKSSKGHFSWKMNIDVLQKDLEQVMDGFDNVNTNNPQHALFIKGGNSPYINEDDTMLIRKYFPSAELITIDGAGHWLHAEKPEQLLKTLDYFLA